MTLIDGLRSKVIRKLHKRYEGACTLSTNVTPKVLKKLKDIAEKARKCQLMMASEFIFEV